MSRHVVLLWFTVPALFPIYFMVVSALKTNSEYAVNQLGSRNTPCSHVARGAGRRQSAPMAAELGDLHDGRGPRLDGGRDAMRVSDQPDRWRPSRWLFSLLIALMVVPPIVLVIPLFQMVVDLHQLNTYSP